MSFWAAGRPSLRRGSDAPGTGLPGPAVVLAAGFFAGSVPFSGLAARLQGTDLRRVGSGTVSGTGLYRVAGFGPLALAGSLDVAKGALGPALAGRDRPYLGAAALGLGITGHNWSPFLGGAGGRGISPALGGLAVLAPEGTVLLITGLAVGRLIKRTALVSLLAVVGLVPLLARRARPGLAAAWAVLVPVVVKRLAGNSPASAIAGRGVLHQRLLYDRDAPV